MKAKAVVIPTAILLIICVVVTALLVLTNSMTADRIETLQIEEEKAARQEVLPQVDTFVEKKIVYQDVEYTYYEAVNGSGYVFQTRFKGYGGAVVVMTGISKDGTVSGVKITSQDETPGLGQKALDSKFTNQYIKSIPADGFSVTKQGASADNEIDSIAGATITSKAVTNSVNLAIELYQEITGGDSNG